VGPAALKPRGRTCDACLRHRELWAAGMYDDGGSDIPYIMHR
jgi:hypothetical protein